MSSFKVPLRKQRQTSDWEDITHYQTKELYPEYIKKSYN